MAGCHQSVTCEIGEGLYSADLTPICIQFLPKIGRSCYILALAFVSD